MQQASTQTQQPQQQRKGVGVGKGNHNPNKQKIDENTESFRNFIRRFRNSPVTKVDYINWLRRYVEYSNLPHVRAKTGVEVGDNTDLLLFDDPRKIQNHIKQFIDYQYDVLHLSPKTVDSYHDAVKHFYQSNEVALNWHIIKDYVGTSSNISANLDMPYTYEEIHKMLDKADERERVIILLLCSTGMRMGALPELRYGDLTWIDQHQIWEIAVYRGFKEEYKTFCSLECASAINSYLDFPVTCETTGQIYRLKHKGKEWLKYFVNYRGHDWKGNELVFNTLVGRYELPIFTKIRAHARAEDGTSQETVQIDVHTTIYDIPFSKQKVKELVDMVGDDERLGFIVIDSTSGRKYSCNQSEFTNDSYDELIDRKTGYAEYMQQRGGRK